MKPARGIIETAKKHVPGIRNLVHVNEARKRTGSDARALAEPSFVIQLGRKKMINSCQVKISTIFNSLWISAAVGVFSQCRCQEAKLQACETGRSQRLC